MSRNIKISLIAAAAVLAGAVCAVLFIELGFYDIGADDHHTKLTLAIIVQLRDRSIEARLGSLQPQLAATPEMIKSGAERYASLCVSCHLAPGLTQSELRKGLYPHPPNLAQEEIQESRRAFWVIKHGIKMSAMPAWGKTLDDAAIWAVVAFVRKLPSLSAEDYQQLTRAGVSRGSY
jgi:mono/diheme cytochrome c family protein